MVVIEMVMRKFILPCFVGATAKPISTKLHYILLNIIEAQRLVVLEYSACT
jgi:hypothetical protein